MCESISVKESDATWLINQSGTKKHGYLLFDAHNLENPLHQTTAKYYNMTFKFSRDESKLVRMMMVAHGFSEVSSDSTNFNLCWGNFLFREQDYKQLNEWQKLNHFPGSPELTQKDNLYRNVRHMQIQYEDKNFNFMPISFTLPEEYKDFCAAHAEYPSTWIIKPIDSSQGRGIYVADQVDQVSPEEVQLVSRYLDSPLLINGYKFDLRLYVVVTSLDPLVIYLYEDGLVRLASEKYQHDEELWNPCIHLTNYSVNKFNSNYVQNEDIEKDNHGNKWSLSAFLRHLKSQNVDTVTLMRNVENVVTRTILAASANMKEASERLLKHLNNCFELYGFDIMFDKNLKPWVLEVNSYPSLNINQPIDLKIKSALVADLFSLHYLSTTHICSSTSCIKECVAEELRVVHQVCDEYKRRGGWNRIFPAEDSWNLYNGILEYETPLNLALHKHLYTQVPRSIRLRHDSPCRTESALHLGDSTFLQRMACYERSLHCGLDGRVTNIDNLNKIIQEKQMESEVLLDNKANALTATGDNHLLGKYQARLAFLAYLQRIQRNLMNGLDKEESVQAVTRFLQSSGKLLQKQIPVLIPYKGIPIKARATILSRQLGDFMNLFNKETFMMMDEDINSNKSPQTHQSPIESVNTLPEGHSKIPSKTNKVLDTNSLQQKVAKNTCQA
ncbi:unnamed protein product [Meganyctiphanes norvegica]|uniref:Tubulin--tyrosine ligase-like protein 5 n=1 Tax=Meganyctiphanes norvegica TaxID=48144 RepID=A0AAV2RJP6_MEGNR